MSNHLQFLSLFFSVCLSLELAVKYFLLADKRSIRDHRHLDIYVKVTYSDTHFRYKYNYIVYIQKLYSIMVGPKEAHISDITLCKGRITDCAIYCRDQTAVTSYFVTSQCITKTNYVIVIGPYALSE